MSFENGISRRAAKGQNWFAVLLAILLVASTAFGWTQATAPATTKSLTATERQLVESINVEGIKENVKALSAPEMLGRGTAQAGGDKAAAYLADRFAKLGLKPLGEKNTYLQRVNFKETMVTPETVITAGNQALKLGPDFYVLPPFGGDRNIHGRLVFVGYGAVSRMRRNDLGSMDVRGKVLVVREGPPPEFSKDTWDKAQAQLTVLRRLVMSGAAGLIMINNYSDDRTYAESADYLTRRRLQPESDPDGPDTLPPFISVSETGVEKLFADSGVTIAEAFAKAEREDFTPIDLKKSAILTVRYKKGKGSGSNVVGLLEGSDPKLKAEALVYSAHYDAYGVAADNRIYHGAADNALGVAEMLSVAEAMSKAAARPRRSVIFIAVTGEEYGGFGSDHWVKNPTWDIKQVAANLNLDGMGTELYGPVKVLVGYGTEHSTLGALMNEVAAASGIRVIPDPMPEARAFYRSDHYLFVKRGIPALMLLGAPDGPTNEWTNRLKQWIKTDYHQPTDVVRSDWDWSGPRTIASLMLVMGLRIANDDTMPSWLPSSVFNRERGSSKPIPGEP